MGVYHQFRRLYEIKALGTYILCAQNVVSRCTRYFAQTRVQRPRLQVNTVSRLDQDRAELIENNTRSMCATHVGGIPTHAARLVAWSRRLFARRWLTY